MIGIFFQLCDPSEALLPTCTVEDTRKLPCSSLLREEEKWNRRVEALETAVDNYISNAGSGVGDNLVVKDNFDVEAGADTCTTSYSGLNTNVDEVSINDTHYTIANLEHRHQT